MAAPLEIAPITGAALLSCLEAHGKSEHGVIASQYEKELTAQSPGVGAIGVLTCGTLVGGLSYGTVPLPREGVSGRLDVVVTNPVLRGKGIGSILVAGFVGEMYRLHGDALRHLSTVAMHPAVERCVVALGFERADVGPNVPLFQVNLDEKRRLRIVDDSSRLMARHLADLRTGCARCKARRALPWCRPENKT
jgi:GNAT superfamily N-acetyltransferase